MESTYRVEDLADGTSVVTLVPVGKSYFDSKKLKSWLRELNPKEFSRGRFSTRDAM